MAADERVDLLVTGAGPAGSLLASRVAARGYKVVVLEASPSDPVGDGVPEWVDLGDFQAAGVDEPQGAEVRNRDLPLAFVGGEGGATVRSSRKVTLAQVLYNPLVRRLREAARMAGAEVRLGAKVQKPVEEDGKVVGVEVRKAGEIRARLVADCSGFEAVLRRRLYGCGLKPMSGKLRSEDQVSERHLLCSLDGDPGSTGPGQVCINFGIAGPGTHAIWQVDEERNQVLAVLGASLDDRTHLDIAEQALRRRIPGMGGVLSQWDGPVAHRRTLDSLVTDGMVAAGDAACQGHPILGWNLGTALSGAAAAADAVVDALTRGATLKADLWGYNAQWLRGEGANSAARHMDRVFLLGCSSAELDALLAVGALSPATGTDGALVPPLATARALPRLAGQRDLLARLTAGAGLPLATRALYSQFPKVQNHFSYDRWQERVIDLNHWAEGKLARQHFHADDGF